MTSKTISELNSATLSDNLVMVVEGVAATEKVTVGNFKAYVNQNKQDKLTAGTNITIENNVISATGGGSQITVDDELSTSSENPVQNKVITTALNNKVESSALSTVATSGSYNDLTNKPNLATVALTGNYNDLTNKPVIPEGVIVDQTYDPTSINSQSGIAIAGAGFLTQHQDISGKADIASLATVAISGDYADLTNKPTIPAAQVQSDWDAVSGMGVILNKPTLATVATSGSYNDLSNKPSIPDAQIQADWNQTDNSALDYIKNKPNIPAGVIVDQTYDPTSANAQSGVAVSEAVSTALSSAYRPAGSVSFANLGQLIAANEGKVYNVNESFTTTIDFVDGLGANYPAGTNVVIINVGTTASPEYKYDVLSGFVDLSAYATTASLATVATTGDYSDLSGTPTLSTVATSGNYSDLTNKPNIPAAQIQSDWNQTDNSALDYIKNKPTIPASVTVDQTYDSTSANAQSGVAIAGAGFLKNTATGTGSITIGGTATSSFEATNVGLSSVANAYAASFGEGAQATGTAATALGSGTRATGNNSVAIGRSARADGVGSIALGAQAKNLESYTFKVALTSGDDSHPAIDEASGLYTMLDSSGKIPDARLNSTIARVSQIPTLPTVDQTYNGTSSNAQSGIAIAGAGFLTSHQDISGKQDVSNLVTSISAQSTDSQYPSAKCMYDMIGNIEAALAAI